MSICNDSNLAILSVDKPANLSWRMGNGVPGSLDGLVLKPGGVSNWRRQPNNAQFQDGKLFVPQGHSLPLKVEEQPMMMPKNSMFMFANNRYSPSCCPSTFSTSGGCVCATQQQRRFVGQRRGDNKNYYNNAL